MAGYEYDAVNNPTAIVDYRDANAWPAGAKPVTRRMQYDDDLNRLVDIAYAYPHGADRFVSPYQAELSGSTDPRRTNKVPAAIVLSQRVTHQQYSYDWLDSLTRADDNANAFWDRGTGPMQNDVASQKPYRFRRAGTSADATWQGTGSADSSGSPDGSGYDESGNLLGVTVTRPSSMPCNQPALGCSPVYTYRYDELGRLVQAQRTGGGAAADLRYAYDSSDNRVLKSDLLAVPAALHTVYIFDTLELRRTAFDTANNRYTVDAQTEVPYLLVNGIRIGRLVHEGTADGEPRLDGVNRLHVFLNVGDHLGSTAAIIDRSRGRTGRANHLSAVRGD